jgi:hypothetical protein
MINTACAGDLWAVKVTVVDEGGRPIEDADVLLNFLLSEGANLYAGLTSDKGVVKAMRRGTLQLIVEVTKEGFYDTFFKGTRGDQEVKVVLRDKKNPIPMYARKTHLHAGNKEARGLWVAYDLIAGDYLPPWGKGLNKDFETKYTYEKVDLSNLRYDLSIRFPNVGDGLVEYKSIDYTSKFRSGYWAPNSGYKNNLEYYRYRSNTGSEEIHDTNFVPSRKYYFRIRTKMDEDGNVISALYGKLYSEFPKLHYYLNPNDNDQNVEFDPRQNLFVNLPKEERQFEP